MPCTITEEAFGQAKNGSNVTRYTLRNSSGSLEVQVLTYGAVVASIKTLDRNNKMEDICLGFDDMPGYESNELLFGAVIGRVANRVAGARFTLDGKTYEVFMNDSPNANHGGKSGFQKKVWSGRVEGEKVILTYVSVDGEENYPGTVTTTVAYSVTDANELTINYEATTTKPTPINLTNHAYFNLAGHAANCLDDHVATVYADHYLPLDEHSIPTGEIGKVEGTELDLRTPVRLGDRMERVPGGKGFDNTYCLPECTDGKPRLAARVDLPSNGRRVECLTTEPAMQFYTSFYLTIPAPVAKGGVGYKQFGAFCLEGQHYPNSLNTPSFPNTILRENETYKQTTIYKFSIAP